MLTRLYTYIHEHTHTDRNKVFDSRLLRGIFGSKREKITEAEKDSIMRCFIIHFRLQIWR
jgi:hypothetical protein